MCFVFTFDKRALHLVRSSRLNFSQGRKVSFGRYIWLARVVGFLILTLTTPRNYDRKTYRVKESRGMLGTSLNKQPSHSSAEQIYSFSHTVWIM